MRSKISLVLLLLFAIPAYGQTTYFVNFGTGSDANSGTSSSSPWKHIPPDSSFRGTYVHHAGDTFCVEGGSDYNLATDGHSITFSNSGSSSAPDYYGGCGGYYQPVSGTVNTTSSGQVTWETGVHPWSDFTNCSIESGLNFNANDPFWCSEWLPAGGTITINGSACTVASYRAYNVITVSGCTLRNARGVSFSFNYWTPPLLDDRGTADYQLNFGRLSYIEIEDWEFTGFYWADTHNHYLLNLQTASNIKIDHDIFTNWSHGAYKGGAVLDLFVCIEGVAGSPYNSGTAITHNQVFQTPIIANADSGTFLGNGVETVEWNDCFDLGTCYDGVGQRPIVAFNQAHDLPLTFVDLGGGTGDHTDAYYIFGSGSGTALVHDNLAWNISGGQEIFFCVMTDTSCYFYNNVAWNITNCTIPYVLDQFGSTSGKNSSNKTAYIINNTNVTCSNKAEACVRVTNRGIGYAYGTVVVNNNHCISEAHSNQNVSIDANLTITNYTGPVNENRTNGITIPNFTRATETFMSHATATADNYAATTAYLYSPSSSSSPTVGAGTNLTSVCSTMAGLCSDTSYAFHGRTQNSRPSSGSWDTGAYEFRAGSSTAVGAPKLWFVAN